MLIKNLISLIATLLLYVPLVKSETLNLIESDLKLSVKPESIPIVESHIQQQNITSDGIWKNAAFTHFTSYAPCCKNSPNYDPNASKIECREYSACKYLGEFAAIGKKSFDWVKNNNIVAFYDDSDLSGKNFQKKYGGKLIRIKKNSKVFVAIIADTCGNNDCNYCCHKNSKNGFLIDMEYWTVMRNFGNINIAEGIIEYQIV